MSNVQQWEKDSLKYISSPIVETFSSFVLWKKVGCTKEHKGLKVYLVLHSKNLLEK